MNPPSTGLRSLAERLVEHETGPQPNAQQVVSGAEAVCRKLASGLEPLVGSTGFHVLLTRALHLAGTEYPLLEGTSAGAAPDLWLEGLRERVRGQEADEVRGVAAAIVSCSLRLLDHFIGNDLAVRIVSRAWPDLGPAHASSAFEEDAAEGRDPFRADSSPSQRVGSSAAGDRGRSTNPRPASPASHPGHSAPTTRRDRRPSATPPPPAAGRHLPEPEGVRARPAPPNVDTASP